MVLTDKATEDLSSLDPGSDIDGAAGSPRRFLPQALMRPVTVIVAGELGQDLAEMPLTEDQHMIQALTSQRAYEPLGKRIAPHRQLHLIRVIGTDASG